MKVKSLSRVRLLATAWLLLPGSSVHGIFQARVLEWGAIAFFEANPSHPYITDWSQGGKPKIFFNRTLEDSLSKEYDKG